MNIIVLTPGARVMDFALFADNEEASSQSGRIADYRGPEMCRAALKKLVELALAQMRSEKQAWAWAVRIPFGGELFTSPALLLNKDVFQSLETLVPQSPLHLPAIIELLWILHDEYEAQPVVLAFETAFFATLPQRESSYALNAELMDAGALRRFGFHGLLHEAASEHVSRLQKDRNIKTLPRILSICLETQPEVAAIIRNRPVMVTSGLTQLEGLPGQTTCGELDPGIIMTLSEKMKWGPERIDAVLTRESGLLGLTGERTNLDELMTAQRYEGSLGRGVMNYRLLLACGAGIAAIGGLTHIVFSGRYADLGQILGPMLISRILMKSHTPDLEIKSIHFKKSRERIIADHALTVLMALPVK